MAEMLRRLRHFVVWIALGSVLPAQTPQFRSAVDLVTLDVTVLDRDGKPVTDLTQNEFIVVENGRPQTVSTFAAVHSPAVPESKAAWTKTAPVDVARNDVPEQRLLVLVIDDATLPFDPWMVRTAKTAARSFIEKLGPTDRTAVVFTRDNRNAQDFTYDKARLLAAVEKTTAGNLRTGSLRAPRKVDDLSSYLSSVNTLSRVSEYLASVQQRKKAVVWLSIGVPLDTDSLAEIVLTDGKTPMTAVEAERSMMIAMRRAIDRAQRGNVAVFGISPAGLDPGHYRGFNEFLQAMASNTGGRAFVNTNDLLPAVTQVFTETSSYYLLGFSPTPRGADGSYRRIEIKATRPGLEVRTRPGYFVTPPDVLPNTNVPLGLSAIKGVLPDGGISLRGVASAFAQSDGTAAVALTVALDSRTLPEPMAGDLAINTGVFDPEGRTRASYSQQARLCAQPGWCEISLVLPITAGRHSLRVGVEHRPSGRSGSVYVDAVVPDFTRRGVWMTGLALEVVPSGPRAIDAAIRTLLPIVPTTRRDVAGTDRVSVFFRVHQGDVRPLTDVSRTIQLTDESDILVLEKTEVLPASFFKEGRRAEQRVELPVAGLKPGRYLLTVSARAGNIASIKDERRELVLLVR